MKELLLHCSLLSIKVEQDKSIRPHVLGLEVLPDSSGRSGYLIERLSSMSAVCDRLVGGGVRGGNSTLQALRMTPSGSGYEGVALVTTISEIGKALLAGRGPAGYPTLPERASVRAGSVALPFPRGGDWLEADQRMQVRPPARWENVTAA